MGGSPPAAASDSKRLRLDAFQTYLVGLALIAGCTAVILPHTVFDSVMRVFVRPAKLCFVTPLALGCKGAAIGHGDYRLVLELVYFAILLAVVWRYRILTILATGSRTARLLCAALLSFALLILVDLFVSRASFYPYREQSLYVWLTAFVLFFAVTAGRHWWRFLLAAILVCVVLQSCYAIVLYVTGESAWIHSRVIPRAVGTLRSPNALYPMCMVGVLMLVPLALGSARVWERRVLWVSAAVVSLALLLTFSRAGGIGLFAGTLWLARAGRDDKRLRMVVAVAFAIMLAMLVIRTNPEGPGKLGVDRAALGRIQIWRVSAKIIHDNWLLGIGRSAYYDTQSRYMDEGLDRFHPMNTEAKNLVLTMLADHGLPGLGVTVLFAFAMYTACSTLMRSRGTEREQGVIAGIAASGIGLLGASTVDTPLYATPAVPVASVIWLCHTGFLLHLALSRRPPEYRWKPRLAVRAAGISIAVLAGLAVLAVLLVGYLDARIASRTLDAEVAEVLNDPGYVPYQELPVDLIYALQSNEDVMFTEHHGFSLTDMHRALRVNIRSGYMKQGGSTITQQLAKNLFFTNDRTVRRKIAELIMARKLEERFSKGELLALYANVADYAMPDSRGITAAARHYYGKNVSDLTHAECALLAGLVPYSRRSVLETRLAESAINHTCTQLGYVSPETKEKVEAEVAGPGIPRWIAQHVVVPTSPRVTETPVSD